MKHFPSEPIFWFKRDSVWIVVFSVIPIVVFVLVCLGLGAVTFWSVVWAIVSLVLAAIVKAFRRTLLLMPWVFVRQGRYQPTRNMIDYLFNEWFG